MAVHTLPATNTAPENLWFARFLLGIPIFRGCVVSGPGMSLVYDMPMIYRSFSCFYPTFFHLMLLKLLRQRHEDAPCAKTNSCSFKCLPAEHDLLYGSPVVAGELQVRSHKMNGGS